ncbi:MAG: ArnT family glycosyltransferase [Kiritimatiellales bacterium]
MRKTLTDLWLPFLIILLTGLWTILFFPILPIDETRYLTVAWEMLNAHSFAVPLLNGAPYAHKPPMLFWLVQAAWKLTGVSDAAPRLVSITAGLASVFLTYRISLRLRPANRAAAALSALLLSSTLLWMLWSCAIMFDILLTAWVLLAILGILRMSRSENKGWLLLAGGIAGGLLTKGPVVLIYIFPLTLLARFWVPERSRGWPLKTATAIITGIGLALLWAVPAAVQGGEEYGKAIFWGQSAGRIHSSFAHQRPLLWYLPLLPAIFLPWIFFRPGFAGLNLKDRNNGNRMLLVWVAVPLLILSLISGKQLHYLIPLLPAGILWMGQNISRFNKPSARASVRLIGSIYLLIGLTALILPMIRMGADLGKIDPGTIRFAAAGFTVAGGILLALPALSAPRSVRAVALCTLLALLTALTNARHTFLESYSIKPFAEQIRAQQDRGHPVAHVGKYHGQYQFLGRLVQPVMELSHETGSVEDFIIEHPDGILISYSVLGLPPPGGETLYVQKYRGKEVVLWRPGPAWEKTRNENTAD